MSSSKYKIRRKRYKKCEVCGRDHGKGIKELTLHHIQKVSEGGLDELDNLMIVCLECHNKIHNENLW